MLWQPLTAFSYLVAAISGNAYLYDIWLKTLLILQKM